GASAESGSWIRSEPPVTTAGSDNQLRYQCRGEPVNRLPSASNLPSHAPLANEESTNCWASSRGNFHNRVFQLLSFPEGMFRARNRGTATAQPKASALQP